ncbi:MAG: efflux RND transporter periplasmic adaptor subunit [Halioglobus sp.]
MSKFYRHIFYCVLFCATLISCAEKEAAISPPDSRPVKIYTVAGGKGSAVRQFPARVDASRRAELAFRVPGQLQEILIREGDLVEKGQLLARLDPTDYKIQLEDRQATYDNAEQNFTRAKELVVDGNISRLDYDRMEANSRTATAALNQASKNLEYTEMHAPFSGRIAQRLVENFEDVLGKQAVFYLQDVGTLDVVINLPESLVRQLKGSMGNDLPENPRNEKNIQATVSFNDKADVRFPLAIKEVATNADSETQTYKVSFSMESPRNFTVLPGMTAQVEVDFSAVITTDTSKWIPVRAVQADSGLNPRVWLLEPTSMTVISKPVSLGRMSGDLIEISDGLEGGEEIVSVGAPYLSEGMKVTRMLQTEQAQPRADDPA